MRAITGILLAAGRSRRFGSNKLLALLPDGTPLVLASLRRLLPVVDRLIVVVQPQDPAIMAVLKSEPVQIVVNQNAAAGMGTSLAAGVAASREAHGWLIALADMPAIQESTLRCVAQALDQGAVLAAPYFAGQRGHPVGVQARFRHELLTLQGDRGARELLAANAQSLTRLEVADAGILYDVDRPGDLAREAMTPTQTGYNEAPMKKYFQ